MAKTSLTLPESFNYYQSRLLNKLAYRVDGSFGRPTGVIVLMTNRCNAKCIHCHSWKLAKAEELNTNEWKRTLTELSDWLGPAFLSLTGGETLLKKDAIEIAAFAARKGFWVEFLTNGFLMDDEKVHSLTYSGVKRVKISLDGSNASIHDSVRGKEGFFEKATWALKNLAEMKHRAIREMEVWGKTSVMNLNAGDLPMIAVLARELGIDGVEYQALEPVYYSEQLGKPDWYRDNPLWITDLGTLSKSITDLINKKKDGYPIINTAENLNLIETYFNNVNEFSFKIHSHNYGKKEKVCDSWVSGLQIMPDGGMKMCHWMEPFADGRGGNIKRSWRERNQCWKQPCRYIP